MTDRHCPICGVPEDRRVDSFGRVSVNLCPLTDTCVNCLVKGVGVKSIGKLPADYKVAQSGRDE